jgi:hypothetical protein
MPPAGAVAAPPTTMAPAPVHANVQEAPPIAGNLQIKIRMNKDNDNKII